MAGHDFAQVGEPKKPESDSESGSLLAIFGIAFVAVVCFAAGFWLGGDRRAQHEVAHPELNTAQIQLKVKATKINLQQARIEVLEKLVEEWEKKAEQSATAKVGELKFYHDLPMQSVTPAPISDSPDSNASVRPALPPHPAKPSIEKPVSVEAVGMQPAEKAVKRAVADTAAVYQIQVSSHRIEARAATFQKKLFNAGFSAFIRSVDLAEKGKWYRVYAGPYSSKSAAEKAQVGIHKLTKTKGILVRGR